MSNILISHEFPNIFYHDGFAENNTDYDYCLIHRYLDTPSYAEYMKNAVKKGRTVYLDNGVYELGDAFNWKEYVGVIEELRPTYYILPDVFNGNMNNVESQTSFYKRYGEYLHDKTGANPIAIPHGKSIDELALSLNVLHNFLSEDGIIAVPFGSEAFKNNRDKNFRYYSFTDSFQPTPAREPILQAQNRKIFMKEMCTKYPDRKFHLLGCKNISEFDLWRIDYNRSNIVSIDTSIPVALTFEEKSFCRNDYYCKPSFLIDKNFDYIYENESEEKAIKDALTFNIKFFRKKVNEWKNFNFKF